jgi:glutamate racemase
LCAAIPREDIVCLADRKNLPYGEKTPEELIRLVGRNLERLRYMGCRKVLIACCTASSVYPLLGEERRLIAFPIITPTSAATGGGRVTVIATERTVKSHAFRNEIFRIYKDSMVTEIAAQSLVALVESGCRDGNITPFGEKIINRVVKEVLSTSPDALVLGCTHFSHLEGCFSSALPRVRIVNSAREGVLSMLHEIKERKERGTVKYTE